MKRLKGSVYHFKKEEEGRTSLQRDVEDFRQGQYGDQDASPSQENASEYRPVRSSRDEEFFFDHEL